MTKLLFLFSASFKSMDQHSQGVAAYDIDSVSSSHVLYVYYICLNVICSSCLNMAVSHIIMLFNATLSLRNKFYYILINEILRNIDEIKCVFSFSIFSL